jgi:hypothetical protein
MDRPMKTHRRIRWESGTREDEHEGMRVTLRERRCGFTTPFVTGETASVKIPRVNTHLDVFGCQFKIRGLEDRMEIERGRVSLRESRSAFSKRDTITARFPLARANNVTRK